MSKTIKRGAKSTPFEKVSKSTPLRLSDCPEEITTDGLKIYGETSLENHMAVLSHYLHGSYELDDNNRREILEAVKDFIERKKMRQAKVVKSRHSKPTEIGKVNCTEIGTFNPSEFEGVEDWDDEQVMMVAEAPMQYGLFDDFFKVPFPAPENPKFTFIDLFAGIGGFRIAMQNLGGKCVYSSEFDAKAQETYFANYGEMPFGDITKESTKSYIPDGFDVLCAGFPCQAFSLAGKKLGFEETRGTLFFDVAEIIRRKRPKAFFLENVKGLAIHDKGRTLQTILNVLRNDLDYFVPDPEIVNAMNFGVPQHRERIYIVGFRKDQGVQDFTYPVPTDKSKRFADVKEDVCPSVKYWLSTQYVQTLINHKARHVSKGNGFGYEIIPDDGVANAIVVGGMGRERNIVIDKRLTDFTPVTNIKGEVNHDGWRRMTPREWARLQGFPDSFEIVVADASAYKQFGNSVAVPAIQATAEQIIRRIFPE